MTYTNLYPRHLELESLIKQEIPLQYPVSFHFCKIPWQMMTKHTNRPPLTCTSAFNICTIRSISSPSSPLQSLPSLRDCVFFVIVVVLAGVFFSINFVTLDCESDVKKISELTAIYFFRYDNFSFVKCIQQI